MTRHLFPDTPAFRLSPHGRDLLLGALGLPHWRQYRTLQTKAGVLLHALIQDHPFIDGNKRFAVTATEAFLYMNRAQFAASDEEITELALSVAQRERDRDDCVTFARRRTFRMTWTPDQFENWLLKLPEPELREVFPLLEQVLEDTETPDRFQRVGAAFLRVRDEALAAVESGTSSADLRSDFELDRAIRQHYGPHPRA